MKKSIYYILTLSVICSCAQVSRAQAVELISSDGVDCEKSKFVGDFDFLLLKPHTSDGFKRPDVFPLESSARIRLAYETNEGSGLRGEFWQYEHAESEGLDGSPTSIDTYNVDLGLYKKLRIGRATGLELSSGVRYNDFQDFNLVEDGESTSFGGVGGYFGLHTTQNFGFKCRGYARIKWAMLYDAERSEQDGEVRRFDVTRRQQELAFGLEREGRIGNYLASLRVGYEMLNLQQYEDGDEGDVGFSGLCLGVTFTR